MVVLLLQGVDIYNFKFIYGNAGKKEKYSSSLAALPQVRLSDADSLP